MALRTMGTAASTSLNAIRYSGSPLDLLGQTSGGTQPAGALDMGTLKTSIKDDMNPLSFSPNSWIDFNGLLVIPRRGELRVFVGDFIAFDPATGWPILISAAAAAGAQWVHSGPA